MAAQKGTIRPGGQAPTPQPAPSLGSHNNESGSTGGFVNSNPNPYPLPPGGPEPSPGGGNVPDSAAPYSPGYDYSGSMDGCSTADIKAGYRGRQKITDAGSDGMQGA